MKALLIIEYNVYCTLSSLGGSNSVFLFTLLG